MNDVQKKPAASAKSSGDKDKKDGPVTASAKSSSSTAKRKPTERSIQAAQGE